MVCNETGELSERDKMRFGTQSDKRDLKPNTNPTYMLGDKLLLFIKLMSFFKSCSEC